MKRVLSLLFFVLLLSPIAAQLTVHKMAHVGYVYQNQSFGEVGLRALMLSNDDVLYRVGGSALIGAHEGEVKVLPKLQTDVLLNFQKGVDFYHSYYFLAGAEFTTKYIAPKVGFSLFGILDLSAGYGFSIDDKGLDGKKLEGLNINVALNLPFVMIGELLN
ncbi:hypothetical protein [Chryseobacterium sp. A301]